MAEAPLEFPLFLFANFCWLLIKLALFQILQNTLGKDFAGKLADE